MVGQTIAVVLVVKEFAAELIIALVKFIELARLIKFIVALATFSSSMAFIDAVAFINSSFTIVAFVAKALSFNVIAYLDEV